MLSNTDRTKLQNFRRYPGTPGHWRLLRQKVRQFLRYGRGGAAAGKQRRGRKAVPRDHVALRPTWAPLEGLGRAGNGQYRAGRWGKSPGPAAGSASCELGQPKAESRLQETGK